MKKQLKHLKLYQEKEAVLVEVKGGDRVVVTESAVKSAGTGRSRFVGSERKVSLGA